MPGELLWLAHQAPVPATDGGRQRSVALIRCVARHWRVTVAVLHDPLSPAYADSGSGIDAVEWLDLSGGRAAQLAAARLLIRESRPPVLRHFSQPGQRRAVRDQLCSGRFRAVVADTPYATGPLPPRSPGLPGQTPLIVNTHNVEREVWQAAGPEVAGGRVRLALDRRLLPAWELRVLNAADAVAFCAERDERILAPGLRPGLQRSVVPNGVDTERLRALPRPDGADNVLFVGRLTYAPNAEAARFIETRLAALLSPKGVTVVIAGGERVPGGAGTPRAGVHYAGRPADLTPLYGRAFAVVAPVFSGSGTRLKVLEALAYGRPLVATAKAVEGLGMSPDVHYLAAEDAAAFAAQLDRLATDGVLWSELAERGRALVEERYSWAVAGEAFLALLARCGVEPTDRVP